MLLFCADAYGVQLLSGAISAVSIYTSLSVTLQ